MSPPYIDYKAYANRDNLHLPSKNIHVTILLVTTPMYEFIKKQLSGM